MRRWLNAPKTRLDIAAGTVDGILNAVILASGRLLNAANHIDVAFGLRVGVASSLTTVFVFFVAHYAELRSELVRAERQLSLGADRHLAASQLGRWAVRESVAGALLAGVCGLVGAALPLILTALLPGPRWLGLCITILFLGALGAALAKSFHGSSLVWALLLMLGGIVLVGAGAWLHVVALVQPMPSM